MFFMSCRHDSFMIEWKTKVVHDPNVCHGKAVIKGTRVMISVILANLADGIFKNRENRSVNGYHGRASLYTKV